MGINTQFFGINLCIAMNSIMQVYSGEYQSEMCFEQALEIHAELTQESCPDRLLTPKQGIENCLIYCKGSYKTLAISDNTSHCVNYKISFNINGTQSTTLRDFPCKISNCLSEYISFECFTNVLGQNNTQDQSTEKDERSSCFGLGILISLTLSCFIAGSLLGICILFLINHYRNLKQRFDTQMPSSVFYQSRLPGEAGLSEGRIIINPMEETEYADIEEQVKMVAKAIQVPSYKDDSSSSSRSRENIYHHLSGLDDRTKSALLSSDSLSEDYINDSKIIEVRNGSPSLKSVIIHTGSPSSKSNGDSKVSPTGSEGNGKYYALEKEYLIFKSDNGCT